MSSNEHVTNRMPTLPGMGKSKALKKWLKWAKKSNKKKKFKKIKLATFKTPDAWGYLVPGEPTKDPVLDSWFNWAMPVTQPGKWDLRDEDGDLHSPAWYLDAYLVSRQEYQEAWQKVSNAAMDDNSHDAALDDALKELDMYGTYINRMLGSDVIEGEGR